MSDTVLRGGRIGFGGPPGEIVVSAGKVTAVGPVGSHEVPAGPR